MKVSHESEETTLELLAGVPVFETLGRAELAYVAEVAVARHFEAGQVIFREGDTSSTCYMVRHGHARALREHPDGRSIALAHFGPGDIFGELAMFDDERRSATVQTLDALDALAVAMADMRRLLVRHPDIAVKLVTSMGRRLRAANERIARQSFQTVQSRVATVLGTLVEQARKESAAAGSGTDAAAGEVLVRITQADIAQLAGSSRESASRFLAVLERAGVLTQGRGRLVVHDSDALGRYVY
ncbi:MAG: Crp/Fnr family transcriptional regulator [Solirubrobacteraceae bacterium MAG38_C4-C5]|nr:Crp/Fnr family transcriptional regulator [Candidatus Siliceabacter maunaloa]